MTMLWRPILQGFLVLLIINNVSGFCGMASSFISLGKLSIPEQKTTRTLFGLSMNSEEKPVKAVGSALGGILGNLKSGRGLFGAEATTSFSKTVLSTVEQQIVEVSQEIRSADTAESIKKSDQAIRSISKPEYSSSDRWDVIMLAPNGEVMEVTVRPTQQATLLIKAWAKENGLKAEDWDLVVPAGTSWTSGIVDPDALIGESGILPGTRVQIVKHNV